MIFQRSFFLFLNENVCCDPSLEPCRQDGSNDGSQNVFLLELSCRHGSNDGSQNVFLWKNLANYP